MPNYYQAAQQHQARSIAQKAAEKLDRKAQRQGAAQRSLSVLIRLAIGVLVLVSIRQLFVYAIVPHIHFAIHDTSPTAFWITLSLLLLALAACIVLAIITALMRLSK